MLREGVVDITPAEEFALDSLLKDLERFYKRRKKIHKTESDNAICLSLKEYTNSVLTQKYNIGFVFWRFFYEPGSNIKALFVPAHDEIHVNLAHYVINSKHPLATQDVDFNKLGIDIYHEWTHVKQNRKYWSKKGLPATTDVVYGAKDYFDAPWEQMAFARAEIEWVRQNIKKTKPEEVFKWIKKWGLVSDSRLQALKKQNPKAYNRILKYAVLFLLKKQAQRATKKKSV